MLLSHTGLKLRLEKQSTILRSFTYALFPTMGRSSPVDWQYLITEHQETQNIRLHQLQADDCLPDLLEQFKGSYAKAVVLVNMEDSYKLSSELVNSVPEPPLPVLVVSRGDGEEMGRCVEQHEGVYARVEAENQVDEVDKVSAGTQQLSASAQRRAGPEHSSISKHFLSSNTACLRELWSTYIVSLSCYLSEQFQLLWGTPQLGGRGFPLYPLALALALALSTSPNPSPSPIH